MRTVHEKVILALKQGELPVIFRQLRGNDGEYHYDDKTFEPDCIKLDRHAKRPWEKVLIHEMLHHLYFKRNHDWINAWENRIWRHLSRNELALLRRIVARAKRRKG